MPLHVPTSRGQRHWAGYVEPPAGPALPCTIIRGRAAGPKLLVTAGIHGAEYSAIETARRLTSLDADDLVGELTILPIVNMGAFWSHLPYVNPLDGKNINRVFPGKIDGSPSERLAAWLVGSAMTGMDAYIDLHCGDIIEKLLPFAIFSARHERSGELAMASGLPYVVRSSASGHSYGAAADLGIPAVLLESGGNGLWSEESVGLLESGVKRIMAKVGMLPDRDADATPAPRLCRMEVTKAPVSGFWHPAVAPGKSVERGAPLGTIHDLVGPGRNVVIAEHGGPVLYHVTSLAISEGEPLVGVAV